jgi:hypothetical protein
MRPQFDESPISWQRRHMAGAPVTAIAGKF